MKTSYNSITLKKLERLLTYAKAVEKRKVWRARLSDTWINQLSPILLYVLPTIGPLLSWIIIIFLDFSQGH